MNISIIGTGYVGLVSGACFAHLGHHVICVDIDETKVQQINNGIPPIYEKGLEELLKRHHTTLTATTSYEHALHNSDITFLCVGTPSHPDGSIDLSFIDQALRSIAAQIKLKESYHSVVVKSTVVPGTTHQHILPLLERLSGKTVGTGFGLGMNPEFLREGVAVDDFLHPDRIVNGYVDPTTKERLHALYAQFACPIVETSVTTAEMIKYASNCFLATKISYMNEIGNSCKHLGIDAYDVAEGMGLDTRIGRPFLNAGIGWGGSCFPKDMHAFRAWAHTEGLKTALLDSTIAVNDLQPLQLITLLKKHIPTLKGTTIGVLGLAFKPETDDIRESRSIPLVRELCKEGATVKVFDPKAMRNFQTLFPTISYCDTAQQAVEADAVIIATAWDEFKTLDYTGRLVLDGRRILEAKTTATTYEGVCW